MGKTFAGVPSFLVCFHQRRNPQLSALSKLCLADQPVETKTCGERNGMLTKCHGTEEMVQDCNEEKLLKKSMLNL
jgi:hypothetical protein